MACEYHLGLLLSLNPLLHFYLKPSYTLETSKSFLLVTKEHLFMLKKCVMVVCGLLISIPACFSNPTVTTPNTIDESVPIVRPGISHHRSPLRHVRSAKIDTYLNGKRVHLIKANSGQTYEHSIDGVWDNAIGEIGFFYNFPKTGKAFISIIGLKTQPSGEGAYQTEPWDRKAFFFDDGRSTNHSFIEYASYSCDTSKL